MDTKRIIISVIATLIFSNSWALADIDPSARDAAADKVRYQNLMREIKTIDVQYARALKNAMSETEKDGSASLETKSQLLSLRDRRDRLIDRVTLIALRHGWKIPGTEIEQVSDMEIPDGRKRVFEPADQMIKDRFARDARAIISKVTLPIISIESEKKTRESKQGGKEKKWLIF